MRGSTARNGVADTPKGKGDRPQLRELRAGRSRIPWAVKADQDLNRLTAIWTASTSESNADPHQVRKGAHQWSAKAALDGAADMLEEFRGCPSLYRWATSSAYYTAVLARLQAASEELVYCQSDDALISKIPGMAAAVRNYIGPSDSRREVYLTYLQNLCDQYATSSAGDPDPSPTPDPALGPASEGPRSAQPPAA